MNNYRVIGRKPVSVVVEMGLGSCLSEWLPFARTVQDDYGILLYERAGINKSPASGNDRTPKNIARELHELLQHIPHKDKVVLIGHSQGGLYAQQFCRTYPECIEKLILLDPLSPKDNQFKELLTPDEYKKSGVDKNGNYIIMRKLAKLKMGWLTKLLLKKAPPFYYYNGYSKEEMTDILGAADSKTHADTVIKEYICAHQPENLEQLLHSEGFSDIPLLLVTHSSEMAIEESMQFGRNTREFAAKIENMWQNIMKDCLSFSKNSKWIQAERSTHYIHLQEPELVAGLIYPES